MSMHPSPSKDLGLQHVLENGLAILEGESFPPSQVQQALSNLIQVFSEAGRGSAALASRNFVFSVEEPAFERFSTFFRYLRAAGEKDVAARLADAISCCEAIRAGADDDVERRSRVRELMQTLLLSLKRERALTRLIPPKDYVDA